VARADALAGWTLGEVAARFAWRPPPDLRRHKGWIGVLLEMVLGATAGSRALPDFPELGIELKTVPVDLRGVPRQSTFVCTAPLGDLGDRWDTCWVKKKLARVLWVPVIGDGPPGERVIGGSVMWSADASEAKVLQADWEHLVELVVRGELDQITGRRGTALQLRPKGRNADDASWMLDEEGEWVRAQDRAFYLRASFTGALLRRSLRL
jgi:DNA mismatch repair protein MutH